MKRVGSSKAWQEGRIASTGGSFDQQALGGAPRHGQELVERAFLPPVALSPLQIFVGLSVQLVIRAPSARTPFCFGFAQLL